MPGLVFLHALWPSLWPCLGLAVAPRTLPEHGHPPDGSPRQAAGAPGAPRREHRRDTELAPALSADHPTHRAQGAGAGGSCHAAQGIGKGGAKAAHSHGTGGAAMTLTHGCHLSQSFFTNLYNNHPYSSLRMICSTAIHSVKSCESFCLAGGKCYQLAG